MVCAILALDRASIAELTLALLLRLVRRVPDMDRKLRGGGWGREDGSLPDAGTLAVPTDDWSCWCGDHWESRRDEMSRGEILLTSHVGVWTEGNQSRTATVAVETAVTALERNKAKNRIA